MRTTVTRIIALVASIATCAMVFGSFAVQPVQAAANMSVSTSGSTYSFGDVVNVSIVVNTGGQSANAFQANFSYPAAMFEGVSGSFSGSVCTLPIEVPDPSGGTARFSCGRPSGYNGTGTVAKITLRVIAAGTGSLGISGCEVLANDGLGTNITGGCSGTSVTTLAANATPTPNPSASATVKASPTPKKSPTPTPSPTVKPSSSATINIGGQTTPTPTITPPPVVELAPTESAAATPESSAEEPTDTGEKRTVGQAIQDIFNASRNIGKLGGNLTGVVALLIAVVPFLALLLAILYLAYRLYMMERRRKRTLDRLFEMELAELAALEGKLDLLGDKGSKGKAQYQEEFKRAKENILRQLKPDFAKPVDSEKKSKEEPKESEKK
ncbi:hypothetical protein BH11PAT4_BH11PAT4_1300 [soil metagenome]